MSKYLELVEGSFTQEHFGKQTSQNPYVAYSINDDRVIYTIVPKEEGTMHTYNMVDLGLPSGLKWADRNVGASSPEDAGLYFQWGDTIGYTADQVGVDKVFSWSNYKFGTRTNLTKYNSTDGLTILESSDDAATVHMGSNYRMPTKDEIQELINNTTQTFIDVDGNEFSKDQAKNGAIEARKLNGLRFTSSNGNSIFIPASGNCDSSYIRDVRSNGTLWSSSLISRSVNGAIFLYFDYSGRVYASSDNRYYSRCFGRPIRGVQA